MNRQNGQLLLEILIAVVVVVAIAALGSQLVLVGQRSNKITGDKDTALKLVEENFEAVRSIATEDWISIYEANKGSANLYYPEQQSGKWILIVGSMPVTINDVDYTRSFYIENVCRSVSRNITTTTPCTGDDAEDPSTQKITASVSWAGGDTVSGSEYVTRWRSKGCLQTNWTSEGGEGDCLDTYYEKDDSVDISISGELKLQ